jgi:hypothetical protein
LKGVGKGGHGLVLPEGGQQALETGDGTLDRLTAGGRGVVRGAAGNGGGAPLLLLEAPVQRLQLGEPRAGPLVAGLTLEELAIDLDRLVREALVEVQLGQRR